MITEKTGAKETVLAVLRDAVTGKLKERVWHDHRETMDSGERRGGPQGLPDGPNQAGC